MKMSVSSLAICFLLALASVSCKKDDDPTTPQFTIEDQINAARPINHIAVTDISSGNWTFQRGAGSNNPLDDAYAERGYLVVRSSSSHYFNLSMAKNVFISANSVSLQY